jgi:hypothetical protein
MAERKMTQPTNRSRDARRVAQPHFHLPAAPAQPQTGAGFDFGLPVSVDEFLEQLKRDDHKRFIRAWQLACKLGIRMTDAFAILEKQDGAFCHLPSGSGVVTLPPQAGKPAPLQHRYLLGLEAVALLAAVSNKGGSDVHAVS